MSDPDENKPATGGGDPVTRGSVDERFRDLAELEQEIRRRLRGNERFLESFLDEDFVDDEALDESDDQAGEEEL